MRFLPTDVSGVIVIEPQIHRDQRGFFLETYHSDKYSAAGLPSVFLQDNHSLSAKDTIRGLHLQVRKPQAKLVRVVEGEIWDVAVDVRPSSATFGRWTACLLSASNFRQLYIPEGCAHGFCVLSDRAQVEYKCTVVYDPADEAGIAFDDETLGVSWPTTHPLLSPRDRQNPSFAAFLAARHHSLVEAR
jgi:dTDP-4-dehydrorhamnose 3,5-epimerase